jgi:hypothetical protein
MARPSVLFSPKKSQAFSSTVGGVTKVVKHILDDFSNTPAMLIKWAKESGMGIPGKMPSCCSASFAFIFVENVFSNPNLSFSFQFTPQTGPKTRSMPSMTWNQVPVSGEHGNLSRPASVISEIASTSF